LYYRKKQLQSVITEGYKNPVWCIGGCGKRTNCVASTVSTPMCVPVFTHYVCVLCVNTYFDKRRKYMNSHNLDDETIGVEDKPLWYSLLPDYRPNLIYFCQTWAVWTNISGVRVIDREIAEGFICKWRQMYFEKIAQI
jgi:hypothetical protein